MIKKNIYTPIIAVLLVFIFAACASKRKRDEAKGLRKAYYNVTAKYNGYFNANVLINESIKKLEGLHRDNYNKVLDVYPYVDVQNFSSVTPDLDKAIEKLAVVATVRRASDWTDDSYLQIGKAQYLKHQYQAAEEAFLYLTEMYNPANTKKAKAKNKKEAAAAKKEAAEERRKENTKRQQERREAQEQAKKEAEKQREADKKAREEEKKLLEKQREADKKAREEEKKDAAKLKKQQSETKKDDLESRNETRKKAAEERAKANREKQEQRERELRERNAARRAGKKVDKTTTNPSDVAQNSDEKEDKKDPQATEPKEEVKPAPKNEKTDLVKTGSNGTPVVKTEKQVKEEKIRQKPDRYFFRRRPAYQMGLVWLARTYIERKLYSDALSIINRLERDGKTFKDVRAMAAVAKADLFLRQEAYEQAIPAVENAVKLSRKRKERSRLIYILAQLYQRAGENNKAYANFDRVLNYTLPYEMEFNARINRVFTNTAISQEDAAKILLAMSKDRKNKDLNDQIYYTLGQVALKNKQKDRAISYFEQSLQIPSQNTAQRAETYYLLAKMYNEEENFVKAKNYFDSTASVLPKNDPRETEVRRYADNLADIAKAISTITLQDSLLKIAAMSDKERRELAKRIKKEREAEAEKMRIANAVANANARFDKNASLGVGFEGGAAAANAPTVSLFFAYDAEKVKRGKREFEKKWGDRKLEDNWRRSNRRDVGADSRATAATNTPLSIDDLSDSEVASILKGVPTSSEEIEKSKKLIEEALFKLGTLYHDKINLDKKAIDVLDKLLTRFPDTKKEVDAWYYLYLSHATLGNKVQAEKYYNLILTKYGNTNYADALRNIGKPKATEETVDKYYEKTYSIFKNGNYKNALERSNKTEQLFGVNNAFQPKFALLAAMCIGNLQGKADYINALKNMIGKHPNTPEEVRAKEILRILDANAATANNNNATSGTTEGGTKSPFVVEDAKPHYIFVVLQPSFPTDDAQVIISDFSTKYHRLEDLKVMNISLGENADVPVAMIRSFKNKDAAMAFITNTQLNPKEFLPSGTYEIFVVTQRNYAEILRQRSIDAYRLFYQQNYQR